MVHQRQRAFRNVNGEIADPLQIGTDLQRGGEQAKIARHRLPQGQQAGCQTIELHLHPIDRRLIADHLFGQFAVLVDQRADSAVDRCLHHAGHFQHLLVQLIKFNGKLSQSRSSFSGFGR